MSVHARAQVHSADTKMRRGMVLREEEAGEGWEGKAFGQKKV